MKLTKRKSLIEGTSLVAQCLRIYLPVQETWVQPLVRGLKIPHATTKEMPTYHNEDPMRCN